MTLSPSMTRLRDKTLSTKIFTSWFTFSDGKRIQGSFRDTHTDEPFIENAEAVIITFREQAERLKHKLKVDHNGLHYEIVNIRPRANGLGSIYLKQTRG